MNMTMCDSCHPGRGCYYDDTVACFRVAGLVTITEFPGQAVEEFRRRHGGKLPAEVLALAKEQCRVTLIAKERLLTPAEFWAYIATLL